MKKERAFVLFLIALFCIINVSAISISPARTIVQFKPNMEFEVSYSVSNNYPNRNIILSVEGDLAEYAVLSKNELSPSGGSFNVKVTLPTAVESPGKKLMYVVAQEKIDEELAKGTMGVSVAIRSVIAVYVPYPGKYLETELRAHNVNVGEPITFELDVYSRGTEEVLIKPRIEIYNEEDNLLNTVYFNERSLLGQSEIFLKKIVNTTDLLAGKYYALSKIDYDGRTAESRADFKIGELNIDIINYTRQIGIGGLRKFEVEIESEWNNQINGIYAEVIILNNSEKITEFRTSPVDLDSWQRKVITGYLDTTEISPGIYDADISIVYYGNEERKSTNQIVQVEFIKEKKISYLLLGGIILGLAVIILIRVYIIRHGKKK